MSTVYRAARTFYESLGYTFEPEGDEPNDKEATISKMDEEYFMMVYKTGGFLVFIVRDANDREEDEELAQILKRR